LKYAWIEVTEVVDGEEILVDGDEILDVGDVPFDPPQYEQVSQEPPVYEQITVGTGNGSVTGMNREGQGGEQTGNCNYQVDGIYGMTAEYYKVLALVFTPRDQVEIDLIDRANAETDALTRLATYYEGRLNTYVPPTSLGKKDTALLKSLRKESKGQASQEDIDKLDNNDILDDWFDETETAMEDEGETWIEDPARTTEELNAFDPETDITWPAFPL
jgi:hypothetical protein